MQPLVSVVIPVYNCEDYLSRCLDSVCKQTYSRLEIICVNDGSTDESGDILNQRAEIDSRLKIIHQKNGGASVARNVALSCVTGEFITMIDADDCVELTMIEKMVEAVNFSSADIVVTGLKSLGPGDKITEILPKMAKGIQEVLISDFFVSFSPAPHAKLYKTKIIRAHQISFPVDVVVGEDAVFVGTYWHYVGRVFVLKEALYRYNAHNAQSAMSRFKSRKLPFSVYAQTVALPCIIYDELSKRRDGVKTLSEWLPCLLTMQLIEHGWVMDAVGSDVTARVELKAISKNCYKQLAQSLTWYRLFQLNALYCIKWLKGRMMRLAGKVKRFVLGGRTCNK